MKQGEIWMADFGPASSPEQAGLRPAVVSQDTAFNQLFTTVIVVPVTSNLKRLEFPATVLLEAGEGGLTLNSVALCYQVMVRGKARLVTRLGALSPQRLAQVQEGVLIALGLGEFCPPPILSLLPNPPLREDPAKRGTSEAR